MQQVSSFVSLVKRGLLPFRICWSKRRQLTMRRPFRHPDWLCVMCSPHYYSQLVELCLTADQRKKSPIHYSIVAVRPGLDSNSHQWSIVWRAGARIVSYGTTFWVVPRKRRFLFLLPPLFGARMLGLAPKCKRLCFAIDLLLRLFQGPAGSMIKCWLSVGKHRREAGLWNICNIGVPFVGDKKTYKNMSKLDLFRVSSGQEL